MQHSFKTESTLKDITNALLQGIHLELCYHCFCKSLQMWLWSIQRLHDLNRGTAPIKEHDQQVMASWSLDLLVPIYEMSNHLCFHRALFGVIDSCLSLALLKEFLLRAAKLQHYTSNVVQPIHMTNKYSISIVSLLDMPIKNSPYSFSPEHLLTLVFSLTHQVFSCFLTIPRSSKSHLNSLPKMIHISLQRTIYPHLKILHRFQTSKHSSEKPYNRYKNSLEGGLVTTSP